MVVLDDCPSTPSATELNVEEAENVTSHGLMSGRSPVSQQTLKQNKIP